ncbi:MAG: hypothetical protein A2173_01950 [Planctomycetes bacterium RBG_13_44_8b]|nr:MAG: hypothetical protein A2173_01950 [Planctomycetes bacterium RBG_13_44_8b]
MKKMLMLVLVLAVASVAGAGSYSISSSTPYVITITATDASDYVDAFIGWTPYQTAGGDPYDSILEGVAADIANLYVYTEGNEGADVWYCALATMTAGWSSGTTLAYLDLNGTGANVGSTPITLHMIDPDTLESIGSCQVMIPEPTTMALLGLGGLLFRRKK